MKSTESEILACEAKIQFADASPAPDTSSILNEFLDDDVIMVGPQGQMMTKAFILDAHRPPKKKNFDKINVTNLLVADLGEVAVVHCRADYFQKDDKFSLQFMRVWHNKQGLWKIVSGTVTVIL